jgi:hypothetical protein
MPKKTRDSIASKVGPWLVFLNLLFAIYWQISGNEALLVVSLASATFGWACEVKASREGR